MWRTAFFVRNRLPWRLLAGYQFRMSSNVTGDSRTMTMPRQDKSLAPVAVMDRNSAKLQDLRKVLGFVDKSLFLKVALSPTMDKMVIITAPRKFGKSALIDLTKQFVQKKPDASIYQQLVPSFLQKYLWNQNDQKKLFEGLEIMKHQDIVSQHFGRYPVIHVNFAADNVSSYEDALICWRYAIHEAFFEHLYLLDSRKLREDQKQVCAKWCHEEAFREMGKDEIIDGLTQLSKYLKAHSGTSPYVLIDEFDAIMTKAMFKVHPDVLDNICNTHVELLGKLLKGNPCVERALLTGITYLAGIGLSTRLNNVMPYRFHQNTRFTEYLALNEKDVQDLIKRFVKDKDKQKSTELYMESNYNGYIGKDNQKLFAMWSVLNHFLPEEDRKAWTRTGAIYFYVDIFRISQILQSVEKLLNDEEICIVNKDKLTIEELVGLRELIVNPKGQESPNWDIFFNFLLDQGYLTVVANEYKTNQLDEICVKIPNREIRREYLQLLRTFFVTVCGFNDNLLSKCANIIDDVSPLVTKDDEKFTCQLLKLYGLFVELFKGFVNFLQVQENTLQSLLIILFAKTGFMPADEFRVKFPHQDPKTKKKSGNVDIVLLKEKFAMFVEIKYDKSALGDKEESSLAGLKQMLDRPVDYCSVFQKGHKISVEKYVFLGITMNKDFIPSISCLANSRDTADVICVSKTECELPLAKQWKVVNLLKR